MMCTPDELFVIGYSSGRGITIHNYLFFLNNTGLQKFMFEQLLGLLIDWCKNSLVHTDIILLLNSCYSGIATRDREKTTRIVKICVVVEAKKLALETTQE